MNGKPTDPFEIFQISKELLSTQQKFLPSGKIFEQFAEYIRNVTQAEIVFGQALLRANTALLASFVERQLAVGKAEDKVVNDRPPEQPQDKPKEKPSSQSTSEQTTPTL
jgi:hypothetical protein